jgi:hypothetical protein
LILIIIILIVLFSWRNVYNFSTIFNNFNFIIVFFCLLYFFYNIL